MATPFLLPASVPLGCRSLARAAAHTSPLSSLLTRNLAPHATRATCHAVTARLCALALASKQLPPWKRASSPGMGTAPARPEEGADRQQGTARGWHAAGGPGWLGQILVPTPLVLQNARTPNPSDGTPSRGIGHTEGGVSCPPLRQAGNKHGACIHPAGEQLQPPAVSCPLQSPLETHRTIQPHTHMCPCTGERGQPAASPRFTWA